VNILNGKTVKNSIESNMKVVHSLLNGGTGMKSNDVVVGEMLVAA
jgi:hypothetical protein